MGRMSQAFSRLSQREKVLVSAMGAALVLTVVFLLNLLLQGKIDTLETNIAAETEALRQIYAATPEYLAQTERFEAQRKSAVENAELKIASVVAEIAEKLTFEAIDRRANSVGKKTVKDFMDFKPPKQKLVGSKKKTGSKKQSASSYWQRDQEISLTENIPLETFYQLLEKIEESPELLFVTELKIERSRLDPERTGTSKLVVSTYYWQEAKPQ